jgi:hypothetical protein
MPAAAVSARRLGGKQNVNAFVTTACGACAWTRCISVLSICAERPSRAPWAKTIIARVAATGMRESST